MPAKQAPSKKQVKEKQKQVIEDKTFGLKNKNKSKVVQQYVAQVAKGAKQAGLSKDDFVRKEKEAQERNAKKAEKKDREAEMRMLFAPAVSKKDKEKERLAKEAAARPKTPEEEIMDSQEAYNDAKRQEDLAKAEAILGADQDDDIYSQIEKERAELRKQGGLTPVTFDSFVAWKERKAKERQMAEVDKAKEMLKAAKELKGKSGRDLFNQLAALGDSLFMDDDEADDDWMKREASDDDDEVFDIQVTGTTFSLSKVQKDKDAAGPAAGSNAQADGEAAPGESAEAGAKLDNLAGQVDAALFLDDDVDLPSDDEDE